MVAREKLKQLKQQFGSAIHRADWPSNGRLFIFVEARALKAICQYFFRTLDARYVISIGADDRPFSGKFMVAHNFAFDQDHLLASVLTSVPGEHPQVDSIANEIPAANWAEREIRDLVGIEPVGHPYPKRLVLPDGWPEGSHPLRKDMAWNQVPEQFDPEREFRFDDRSSIGAQYSVSTV